MIVMAATLLAGFGHVPLLRETASFLIVEHTLRPAAAIIALAGKTPFREMEAARLYRAGFAPPVIIVREAPTIESEALQQLGVKKPPSWELSHAVLVQQGVPPSAIVIAKDEGIGTLEELQAAWETLVSQRSEVSGQRSDVRGSNNEQGAGSREERAEGEAQSGKRPEPRTTVSGHRSPVALSNATNAINANKAERDNAKNAINAIDALPVILVTSKYHTRRTYLIWNYVTAGRSQAIVRAASGDPFEPEGWWHTRRYALAVVREYLGLINYYAGFPVAP